MRLIYKKVLRLAFTLLTQSVVIFFNCDHKPCYNLASGRSRADSTLNELERSKTSRALELGHWETSRAIELGCFDTADCALERSRHR